MYQRETFELQVTLCLTSMSVSLNLTKVYFSGTKTKLVFKYVMEDVIIVDES